MNTTSTGGSELSRSALSLLKDAIEALTEKGGPDGKGSGPPAPSLFPKGIGGITVSLTVGGDTASIAISSPPPAPGEFGIFRTPPPPPPHAHVHPMEVIPLNWTDTTSATYTVAVYSNGNLIGKPQPIKPDRANLVDLDDGP